MSKSERADKLLVSRGFFESRERAQAAIEAGLVTADGAKIGKPSQQIAQDAEISAQAVHPYVSRGALKLEAALNHFKIDPRGKVCLDVGASTGGFTEILLARGAAKVYAVDTGTDQLHTRLRNDPRVVSFEQTDIRKLEEAAIPDEAALIVIDVSFISLELVLPQALAFAAPHAELVALIKPQFEAGRENVPGGVVRDPAVREAVVEGIKAFGTGTLGLTWLGCVPSPLLGPEGNVEFLARWRKA